MPSVRRLPGAETAILLLLAGLTLPAWLPSARGLLTAALDRPAWSAIPPMPWTVWGRTLVVVAVIAVLSTALAWPLAQVLRRAGARRAALVIAPLWTPAWLIYAGLNLARAPDTLVGRAFMHWALDPANALFGNPDNRWAIVGLGRALAVGSLVLWSVPLGALVMAASEDPEAEAAEALLRIDRPGPIRRLLTTLRLRRRALTFSAVCIALLMMGSAVPLHLAQVETGSIVLWRALAERSPQLWGGVWLGAWPALTVAAAGSWWLSARVSRPPAPGLSAVGPGSPPPGRWTSTAGWLVWALGAVLPMALMAWSLDELASIGRWVRMDAEAVWTSGWIASAGGIAAAGVGVLTASAAGSDRALARGLARWSAAAAVFGVLAPGVLVGAGIAALNLPDAAAAVAVSAARTVFVGALAGLIVARSEPPDERAARALDGAGDGWGWLRANRARAWRLALGVWLGATALGLHEIEGAVLVRAPGAGNLPQQMLSDLHYARLEQLSAGGVAVGLAGITLGLAAGWAMGPGLRQPRDPRGVTLSV